WPVVVMGEEPVRLLSLQHNLLTRIDPPHSAPALVLLDLYHNHIHNLQGLHAFPNLRVLMLAKNRLSRLEGLEHLSKLEVLDLHGNQLHHVQGLQHLKELRLLNLAGNMLRHVNSLRGLDSLVELNLRRNLIRTVGDLHYLPKLEKVFLGYNEIYRFEDIGCLSNCQKLRELSMEENPLSRQPQYFHQAVQRFFRLKKLDEHELTVECRRQAEKMMARQKEKERAQATRITDEEKRNSAITGALKHWGMVKKDVKHIKQIKRKNETSYIPSKESDTAESSSGICGDFSEDGDDDSDNVYKENEIRVIGREENTAVPPAEQKPMYIDCGRLSGDTMMVEDDRISLASSATSSSGSDSSSSQRSLSNRSRNRSNIRTHVRRNSSPIRPKSGNKNNFIVNRQDRIHAGSQIVCEKRIMSRSKSYSDILRRKGDSDREIPVRPKSSARPGETRRGSKIGLDISNRSTIYNRPNSVTYRDKTKPRIISNESVRSSNIKNKSDSLKNTDSLKNLANLPDKVISAAITRVASHLSLPNNELNSTSNAATSETSEVDSSSSDNESGTSATTDVTPRPHVSVEPEKSSSHTQHSLAELKVPLTRPPRDLERAVPDKTEKSSVPGIGQGVLREQGPNFLAELEGEKLSLYGQGALRCTDISWDKSMASVATTARFQYMNFDDIVDIFHKLRVKFPRLEHFVFVETHLAKCSQLNALAELHQVTSLEVRGAGNPLTELPHWRLYAIFRLSHWGLRTINGIEITEDERVEAALMFSSLSQLAFTCLPRDQLSAFLNHHNHPDSQAGTHNHILVRLHLSASRPIFSFPLSQTGTYAVLCTSLPSQLTE
ncbi:unnamed protein product, partial [Meganyctiphanes norvegica]